MEALAKTKIWTDDELMALDGGARKHELWFGKVVAMSNAGVEHSDIIMRLGFALYRHIRRHKLGKICEGQTGFRLSVDLSFSPDLSFVSHERIKQILPIREKLFHGAPDLAIEVLSPSDSITKTEEKFKLLLMHGSRLGWMVDPRSRSVRVYREPGKFDLLRTGRILTGNSVIPGFRLPVARLFAAAD